MTGPKKPTTEHYGVDQPDFREALSKHLRYPRTKKIYFLDILGAHAWAHPLFNRYLLEQARVYATRNHTNMWNLKIKDELIRSKIDERLAEGKIDVDDVFPDYHIGSDIDFTLVRILCWSDEDMKSDIAQQLIDLHSMFNIPLLHIPPENLSAFFEGDLEYHAATYENNQLLPQGCWIYFQGRRMPFEEYSGTEIRKPVQTVRRILKQGNCVFALEKRRELLGHSARGRRVLFINGPTRDEGGFKGSPTSLLYALAPLIEEIKAKKLDIAGFSRLNIWDPTNYTKSCKSELIKRLHLIKPDIVGISSTSDSIQSCRKLAEIIREYNDGIAVILGGPHCDEVDFTEEANPNNPLGQECPFDFIIVGDGEYMLLSLVRAILEEFPEWNSHQGDRSQLESIKEHLKEMDDVFGKLKGKAKLLFNVDNEQQELSSQWKKLQLAELPPLRYEYIANDHFYDFDVFRKKDDNIMRCVQVITHRGCSGRCNFCSERILCSGDPYYFNATKSAEAVVDEILYYVMRFDVEAVFFDDSTFIEKPKYVYELCNEMTRSGLARKIKWGCLNRFDRVRDRKLIHTMAEAGMQYMYLGLELFDDAALRRMRKDIVGNKDPSQLKNVISRSMSSLIEDALEMLDSEGIDVGVSILFGLPNESEITEQKTIKFVGEMVEKGTIRLVSLSLLNYHLGSALASTLRQRELDYYSVNPDLMKKQGRSPWDCFEEGGWFDASFGNGRTIDEEYLRRLLKCVNEHIKNEDVFVRKEKIQRAFALL